MSETREGIVLRSVPYGENRLIVNIFTADGGTFGLIATISKKGKAGLKKAHFQNLQILEFSHAEKSKGELKRLEEARIHHSYQNLFFDPIRSCLSLFLAELLYKVLKEEEPQAELYAFIKDSLIQLDQAEGSLANFHLAFLMELSGFLGLFPDLSQSDQKPYFDLLEGQSCLNPPQHSYYLVPEETLLWQEIQVQGMRNWQDIKLKKSSHRRQVLQSLVDYFRLHLNDFGEIRSLSILREVMA